MPADTDRTVRLLWSASAAISAATWSGQIAVTVQVLRDHGPAILAAVALSGSLPRLVMLPVAGLCADRLRLRRLALTVTIAQTASLAGLVLAIAHGHPAAIAVAYATQGALLAFWSPTRQQWLYRLIPAERRHRANAAIGSVTGLTTALGAVGGGVLSAWHPASAAGLATALLAGTIGVLAMLPESLPQPGPTDAQPTGRAAIIGGFTAVRRQPLANSVVLVGIAWGFIGGGYVVLLGSHLTDHLHGGAVTLGVVFALDGLSVIGATVLAGRLPQRRHLPVYAAAYSVQGLLWAGVFLADGVAVAVLALVAMRLAGGFIIALDTTILLHNVPDDLRGRVTSAHHSTFGAMGQVSLGVLSAVLTVASVQTVGVVAGLLSSIVGAAWWLSAGRRAQSAYRTS